DTFDHMTTWHYVTIPEGETYETIEKEPAGDIIKAIEESIKQLSENFEQLSDSLKAEHLKILVHLIGDLHQPLHVGNGTDRGGNDFDLTYFGRESNLHRVWDSEMINGKEL